MKRFRACVGYLCQCRAGQLSRAANQVAVYVVDPARYFPMYPEVVATPDAKAAMMQDRLNVVVARPLAQKFGWTRPRIISMSPPCHGKTAAATGRW